MYCILSRPKELKQIPADVDLNQEPEKGVVRNFDDHYFAFPLKYRSCPFIRITLIAMIAIGGFVLILHGSGHLNTFFQDLPHFFNQINWKFAAIGIAVFYLLSVGAFFVIHRVLSLKDRLTKEGIGKLTGESHWVESFYTRSDRPNQYYAGYIDTSTLKIEENGQKNGMAFMYSYKPCNESYSVSTTVIGATPGHVAAAMVYNSVRLVLVPLYLLGCMGIEKIRGKKLFKERFFEFKDIPKEMKNSLKRIVKAPFYGTAIIFAALYAFVDPLNGRKLGSYIERDWNEQVTRAEGFWSLRGWQSLWRFEGGMGPEGLGKNGFYLAGCWQPIAVVYFENGKLKKEGVSLSKALRPERGKPYSIYTKETLIQEYNERVTKLETQDSQAILVMS